MPRVHVPVIGWTGVISMWCASSLLVVSSFSGHGEHGVFLQMYPSDPRPAPADENAGRGPPSTQGRGLMPKGGQLNQSRSALLLVRSFPQGRDLEASDFRLARRSFMSSRSWFGSSGEGSNPKRV